MRTQERRTKFWLLTILLSVLVAGGFLVGARAASAQDSGPTVTGDVCMQTLFSGGAPVTSANRVNCTANDIRISSVVSVSPTSCTLGEVFTLTGTFGVTVTANTRYDAAFFFNINGGDSAREGTCSLSVLTPGEGDTLDLDGDTCGDLNSGETEVTFTIPGVVCADPDGNNILNLPNCTSWHNKAGTVCTAPDPPTDTTTPNAAPDTKSKCVCEDTFEVGVIVQKPAGALVKTATKALVTYEVKVTNTGTRDSTVESLVDTVYGDLDKDSFNPIKIKSSTCDNGSPVANTTGVYTCEFTVEYLNPGSAGPVPNTVNAKLRASSGTPDETAVSGSTSIDVKLVP